LSSVGSVTQRPGYVVIVVNFKALQRS